MRKQYGRLRLTDLEGWKLLAIGLGSGAAFTGALIGILTLILRHS